MRRIINGVVNILSQISLSKELLSPLLLRVIKTRRRVVELIHCTFLLPHVIRWLNYTWAVALGSVGSISVGRNEKKLKCILVYNRNAARKNLMVLNLNFKFDCELHLSYANYLFMYSHVVSLNH